MWLFGICLLVVKHGDWSLLCRLEKVILEQALIWQFCFEYIVPKITDSFLGNYLVLYWFIHLYWYHFDQNLAPTKPTEMSYITVHYNCCQTVPVLLGKVLKLLSHCYWALLWCFKLTITLRGSHIYQAIKMR